MTERGCLAVIDGELRAMMHRLIEITDTTDSTEADLYEAVNIYSNVHFVFVYLEGNQRHLHYEALLRWRDAFFNSGADAKTLRFLSRLRCQHPDGEAIRNRWMTWFRSRVHPAHRLVDSSVQELQLEAGEVLKQLWAGQSRLLGRLGVEVGEADPSVVFQRVISRTENSASRSKLIHAWNRIRDAAADSLTETLDKAISLRQTQASAAGYTTAFEQMLERCDVTEETARRFVQTYLRRAVASHAGLSQLIAEATGSAEASIDDFNYGLRTLVNGRQLPLLRLDDCLDYIRAVASSVFGVAVSRQASQVPNVVDVVVRARSDIVGLIRCDLLNVRDASGVSSGSVRPAAKVFPERYCPVARVLCRFDVGVEGERLVTFEAAHSMFHEFGHALNHVLLRTRRPSDSGLGYLPLERLEDLSTWFEKWAYHPELGRHLGLSGRDQEGMELCQRVQKLESLSTGLESAVTAAVDLEVHASGGGLKEAYRRLDDDFGIGQHCSFGRIAGYFTWPMFTINPGAGFVYLWGSASSAQRFAPFIGTTLPEISAKGEFEDLFSGCFDPEERSVEPDTEPVFEFYDAAVRG